MYTVIKGSFIVVAPDGLGPYQPDGDTIRFVPDDAALLAQLPRRGRQPADTPAAAVRFEGVDALEKDQEPLGARGARDRMLALLGFANVVFKPDGFTVEGANPGRRRGHLLANALDKYGRVLAFVFAGDPAWADGANVLPTADDIATSVNWQLLAGGQVYPTFYTTLPRALRDALIVQARAVRTAQAGVWARATGTPEVPARIRRVADLREGVLFPTLHRRLVSYVGTAPDLTGLPAWIRARPDERNKVVHVLATNRFTDLPGILRIDGDEIQLTLNPEDFEFVDGPPVEGPGEGNDVPAAQVRPGSVVIVGALVNPKGDVEMGQEAVTLLNTHDAPVSLSGWSLKDNLSAEPLAGHLEAGATLRLTLERLALGNRADRLVLVDAGGQVIDKVSWQAAAPEGRTLVFPWPRADLVG